MSDHICAGRLELFNSNINILIILELNSKFNSFFQSRGLTLNPPPSFLRLIFYCIEFKCVSQLEGVRGRGHLFIWEILTRFKK